MKSILLLFLAALIVATSTRAADDAPPPGFDLQKIVDGVYVAVRKEPPGLFFNCNSVFIINERDVVVVDTNIRPSSAKEVLAALRSLTDKPVRYVVNTHWHDDHISGNQVYRDAFPGVEFIGHESAPGDMATVGASNRKQLHEQGPGFVDEIRAMVGRNESFTREPLTPEERVSHLSDIDQAERYFAEAKAIEIIPPTITVKDRVTLHRGSRTIDIRWLGRAHTAADLVVHLPREGIVLAGDLVVWPVPLIGSTSYPADYASTLEGLLGLKASVIVPGHGPVMRDDTYVNLMIRMLRSLNQQVVAAAARGEKLPELRKGVNLAEFRDAFAGHSKIKRLLFNSYVAGPGVGEAYRQATGEK
jgi:glyoxylase-like metal-dependent hydrolase (beta-lactamase superfamily II)